MANNAQKKSFNKRAFVSTALLVSGLLLPFTGLMNHKLQFELLTVERHFWMAAHDVAGILFIFFSILHLSYNWKSLLGYALRAKELFISKEALAAITLVIVIVGLISSHAFHAGR
jgi:hypothetical protein